MFFKSLYIDPGTGSMLFSIIIGIAGVLVFATRGLWIKLKFLFTGGRGRKGSSDTMAICIFSESKRYWSVFRPVCDEFEKRQKDIWYLTASPDDPALKEEYRFVHTEFIGEGNKAISKMNLISAGIVVSTTPSLDVFQWKRSKGVRYYVHLPHAATDINMYKMFGLDFYDAVLLSGQYQIDQLRKLEELRHLPPKDLKLVGIPYMDKMIERKDALPDTSSQDKSTPTVLLAPSWGANGILSLYGSSFIDELINSGYHVIIRPHPQSFTSEKKMMDDLMDKYPDGDKVTWNRDPDNFDVLNRSDILISDFSGVIFDYALVFNKPVIYTTPSYDKSQYDCVWDDLDPWTFRILPSIGRELTQDNFSNIGSLIKECLYGASAGELAKGRDTAREQTWCDMGHGAENVTNYLLKKHDEIADS